MKKALFTFLAMVSLFTAKAQTACNPAAIVTTAKSYIIPDSATGLKHACAGVPYDETIYVKAFKDTLITFFGVSLPATVDSVVVNVSPDSIGVPSYITVSTVPAAKPPSATYNFPHVVLRGASGDSLMCIRLQGTVPAGTPAGATQLRMPFTIAAQIGIPPPVGPIDTTYTDVNKNYKFIVDPAGTGACNVAIKQFENVTQALIVPNPAKSAAALKFTANNSGSARLRIANSVGQVVTDMQVNLVAGTQSISLPVDMLSPGLYTVSIGDSGALTSLRLIVE